MLVKGATRETETEKESQYRKLPTAADCLKWASVLKFSLCLKSNFVYEYDVRIVVSGLCILCIIWHKYTDNDFKVHVPELPVDLYQEKLLSTPYSMYHLNPSWCLVCSWKKHVTPVCKQWSNVPFVQAKPLKSYQWVYARLQHLHC